MIYRQPDLIFGDDFIDVCRQIRQDFNWEITDGLVGSLDSLAWIRHGHGHAQILTDSLYKTWFWGAVKIGVMGLLCESVEMANKVGKILIAAIGFEAKLVLERNGKCDQKVYSSSIHGQLVLEVWEL